ncbi:MAG: Glutamyl-tRNA(Gln) amidotransferase subunit A [Deltaproteobacteria bacterium]|nr:Glutamyl-tRNA(Gln) amidotransferase subunit A [Deltaproteobacteria bacterium]
MVEEYPGEIDGKPVTDYIEWLRFSFLSTTTGLPSVSMPAGFTKSGLPVGLQLIGPPRGEAKLLAVARAVEISLESVNNPIDPIVTHV